jgi:hypothetical protein
MTPAAWTDAYTGGIHHNVLRGEGEQLPVTIDFGKLPFEKALHLIVKILPGFALLSLYDALHQGTIQRLFSIPFLGYATKLGLVGMICFLGGYSLTSFLSALEGAIGHAIGYLWASIMTDRHPYQDAIAPWRDERWRSAYEQRYGAAAPRNLKLNTAS